IFFFQAEDGIRDRNVTGVQTCALPISLSFVVGLALVRFLPKEYRSSATLGVSAPTVSPSLVNQAPTLDNEERMRAISQQLLSPRSEERRVGKGWRARMGEGRGEE